MKRGWVKQLEDVDAESDSSMKPLVLEDEVPGQVQFREDEFTLLYNYLKKVG